ncbi:BirA family biotin operon repressor/biotin-[acetyl-CoA-carboxylase] ligase [Methanofollis sp. W23]|uniref:biotin--[acetyl-CoA-carboxylase] ligase n=1 Tax=Methanofollis sp. W23 TaxID=2817849 RepID=UPI001AE50481|nr:biotin--[acetyl-CoA-carboxylase] ligase [Methanofollis sp. W23]MBP2145471.1 BirA family biotin operon repressor/biotin-[acetyl-CoA-carboxylase] ligase [Methanofollis sp. W23]
MNELTRKVLTTLETTEGSVTPEALSATLGLPVSSVARHIKILREAGYDIESSIDSGYLLVRVGGALTPETIQKVLKTTTIGKEIAYYESTTSTNWAAKKLCAEKGVADLHGTLVVAEEQTGGFGRLGRAWASPKGGIWASVILKPTLPIDALPMIMMAASVAVARAIRRKYDLGALIKWPNDVYIGDKKVAGLILELSSEGEEVHYCLLGLGIDANVDLDELSPELRRMVTSISAELGQEVDRASLLAMILREFESRYRILESGEFEPVIREWKSLSLTLDTRVSIRTMRKTFEGVAIDIDQHGALIIRRDNGRVEKVVAGDIVHL